MSFFALFVCARPKFNQTSVLVQASVPDRIHLASFFTNCNFIFTKMLHDFSKAIIIYFCMLQIMLFPNIACKYLKHLLNSLKSMFKSEH